MYLDQAELIQLKTTLADPTTCEHASYTDYVFEPTCTEAGYTMHVCPACAYSYNDTEVPASHTYDNDTDVDCNVCGETREVEEDTWTVGAFDNYSNLLSLVLEGEIYINLKLKLDGIEGIEPADLVEHMGLAVYYTDLPKEERTVENADVLMDKVTYNASTEYFTFQSNGIPAKNMGDKRWYIAYVELPDGTILYSGRFNYSPKQYATDAMTNPDFDNELKALCVALMNYGAAAQVYFAETSSYTYETLMNAGFEAYQSMVNDFDESMLTARVSNTKTLDFAYNNNFFTAAPRFSLSLVGAIDMNFYYTAATSGTITSAGILVWDTKTYATVDTLTLENAKEVIYADMSQVSGADFKVSYAGTPAKEMGDTVYVVGFYEIGGTTYYSGVVSRSIEDYAKNEIKSTTSAASLQAAMKAMVVYGDHAKNYFANN